MATRDVLAPIALFAFNRPAHTARTIDALKACDGFDPRRVTIFCDGPRRPGDAASVDAVRELCREQLPTASIVEAVANQGLANSIIAGTNRLINEYGRVIVLEDDLVVSPDFLTFMDEALENYADEPRVMQISGFLPDLDRPFDTAVFLPQTSSWSWATWQRAWQYFEPEPSQLERLDDPVFRRRFNRDGGYDYRAALLRQLRGETDSWAIRWYWSVFKRDGLTLYPPRTLVANIGFDGSGTHGARGVAKPGPTIDAPAPLGRPVCYPTAVDVDPVVVKQVNKVYRSDFRNPLAIIRSVLKLGF